MKRIALLLTVLLTMSSVVFPRDIGSSAPNFTLDKLSGGNGMLSDYNGKVIFVFMFGYACPYCIGAAPEIKAKILAEFNDNPDFVAVGIDVWNGSKSQVQNFDNSTSMDMTLYMNGRNVATSWETSYDRLIVVGADGKFKYIGTSGAASTISQTKSAIQEALNDVATPLKTTYSKILRQNFPNPFTSSTTIPFQLKEGSDVKIEVVDLAGKKVETLANGYYPAGENSVVFTRNDLNTGVYFYRIKTGNEVDSRVMTIK